MALKVETVLSSKTSISMEDVDYEHDRVRIVLDDDTELIFKALKEGWGSKLVLDPEENADIFDTILWPKSRSEEFDDEEDDDDENDQYKPSEEYIAEREAEAEGWRAKIFAIISEDQLRRLTQFYINVERGHGFGDMPQIGEHLELWKGNLLSSGAGGTNPFPKRTIKSIEAFRI